MSELVSVVIPSHDYGRYLPEAVASVRNQSHDEIEIIVVDDGSTDGTPEVLRDLEGPDLRWRRTENRGVSAARNLAVSLSEGDVVAFLDADDRWRPDKLEKQLALLRGEPGVDFVFSDFGRFDGERVFEQSQFDMIPGMSSVPSRPASGGVGMVVPEPMRSLFTLRLYPIYPSALMVRGEVARSMRFPEDLHGVEDLYYALALSQRGPAGMIDEPLAELRRHGENLSTPTPGQLEKAIDAVKKFRRRELQADYEDVVRRVLGKSLAGLGHRYFWNGRPWKSGRAYLEAMAYPGFRTTSLAHLLVMPLIPVLNRIGRMGGDGAVTGRGG